MSDFKDLEVWQKAHKLAIAVHHVASRCRAPAYTSLRSQMIRSAISIDNNIAEGRGKHSDRELIRFLRMSTGSCYELEAQLILARDLGFVEEKVEEQLLKQLVEVRKMLFGLIRCLEGDH